MSVPAQRSFAGGEIAPALYARTDQVKYATGLRACRNLIVRRHGGATLRSGTRFIQESKDSSDECLLRRFVRDATSIADTFLLEFGDGYLRFYQDGGAVVTSGVTAWANVTAYAVGDLVTRSGDTYYCISAHTSATATDGPGTGSAWQTRWYLQAGTTYEIPTPYATADLVDLQLQQKGDVITITHGSYAPRELQRYAATRWILTAVDFGPSIDAPTNVVAAGGAAGTIRYWAVTAIKQTTLEESLAGLYSRVDRIPSAGTPATLTWNSVPGAISYNVYRSTDGLTYGLINSAGGLPSESTDTTWTDADEIVSSLVADIWAAAAGQLRNPMAAISATVRAYDGKYTVSLAYILTGGGDGSGTHDDPTPTYGRFHIYYSRDGEARVLAATSDIYTALGANVQSGSAAITVDVPDNGYATLQIDVVPEVQPTVGGFACSMEISAAAGVIAWRGGATGFSDAGDTPDYAIGPPSEPTLLDVADGYPAAVAGFQQRRFFASSVTDPDTIWGSRIGSRASFARSTPLQDDDMIQFAIESNETQVVKHLLDVGRLLAFTTGGVFQCGDASDGSITPTTPNPRRIDANGIGRIRPLDVSDSVLFLEGRQTIVRDLQPVAASGAVGGYTGKDLTVFAAHLFDGYTIVDWDYAKVPHSIIYAIRSDGVLLALTYLREHELWAWHRHDTDGAFERVCVVPEGDEDAVYVVVRRTINGATKRYIERFAARFFTDQVDAFFVDCGLSYDGRNSTATTMIITGGVEWGFDELMTITASAAAFVATNVGDAVVFTAADGSRIEIPIETYVSATVVQGHPRKAIPLDLQSVATATWTLAVSKVAGLAHLEGATLAVLGDGFVEASPNNPDYDDQLVTVTGGQATLSRPYGVIHAGLPFIADLETLDLDSSGPRSLKDKKTLVSQVGVFVEASRGIFAGSSSTVTDDAPTEGLEEKKGREAEDYDSTPEPFTGYFDVAVQGPSWDNNGGVLLRQVDPVPMTILAVMTHGYLGGA